MRSYCTLIACLFTISSFSQSDTAQSKNEQVSNKTIADTASRMLFTKVDIEASIDPALWRRYLIDALEPYVRIASKKKIPAGTYIVNVKFLIERDGSISDVSALNNPGYGLAEGAVEVLKSGPHWTAGIQNGVKVRSYRTQPITFVF